jgi:ribosomal protein S15P/S13E
MSPKKQKTESQESPAANTPTPGELNAMDSAPVQPPTAPVEPIQPMEPMLPVSPVIEPPQAYTESIFKKVMHFAFSPETRLGRILRPVLRWLATIIGLFALGLLVGYLLLYQPTVGQLTAARQELTETQQTHAITLGDLETSRGELAKLQQRYDQLQSDYTLSQARVDVLYVLSSIQSAHLSLVKKDGANAQKALDTARADLTRVLPYIKSKDASTATQLETRLTLVISELNDPVTAEMDLNLLSDKLAEFAAGLKP